MAGQLVACHDAAVIAEPDNSTPGAMPDRRRSKRHGAMVRADGELPGIPVIVEEPSSKGGAEPVTGLGGTTGPGSLHEDLDVRA